MSDDAGKERSEQDPALEPGGALDALLIKAADGVLSREERQTLETWLAEDPTRRRQFLAGQAVLRQVRQGRQDERTEAWLRPSLYERLTNALFDFGRQWRGSPLRRIAAFSASAVAVCAVVGVVIYSGRDTGPAPIQDILYTTQIAEIREETLRDGSVITIGAASSIRVVYSDEERRVVLTKGEAFFDVESDPSRAFTVVANGASARALGTAFDVSIHGDGIDVAVLEGRVEVVVSPSVNAALPEQASRRVLAAGERASAARASGVGAIDRIATKDIGAWRRGELIWVDTPVSEIIADLNRYSPNSIALSNADAGDLEYTFGLSTAQLDEAPELIAEMLALELERRPNGDIVLR